MPLLGSALSCLRSPYHQWQKKTNLRKEKSKPSHTRHSSAPSLSQTQSLFFTKFPLEIRHIIYLFAVPLCTNVDITYSHSTRLRSPWPSDSAEYAEMHTNTWHYPVNHKGRYHWESQEDFKRLSLVCRKMYDEIACILCSSRVYYFSSPASIVHLQMSIPLDHFNRITSIRILFCSNYANSRASEFNAETFQSALQILQQMPNLQSFHILLAHECWRDHFFLKAHPQGNHPYQQSDFNSYRSRFLIPPPWFETLGERVWLRPGYIGFDLKDLVPYLQWAKDIPCHGEILVQLHVLPLLYATRDVGNSGNPTDRLERPVSGEMRLTGGEFVEI